MEGPALEGATAGEPSVCRVRLMDSFENAIAADSKDIRFGIALCTADEKPRRKKRKSDKFAGKWVHAPSGGSGKGRPCFDFARGKCAKGASCKWAHIVPDPGASSTRKDPNQRGSNQKRDLDAPAS